MLQYISAIIGYKKVKFYMPHPKETQETCKTLLESEMVIKSLPDIIWWLTDS